eukprot:m.14017 g.14017  ORF g.14017 m.14017 type:complete len:66 (+) comp4716_c0_seq1:176-373(+)
MENFVNSPNHVPQLQQKFQTGTEHVFLKTSKDRAFFKFAMVAAGGVAVFAMYGMSRLVFQQGKKK